MRLETYSHIIDKLTPTELENTDIETQRKLFHLFAVEQKYMHKHTSHDHYFPNIIAGLLHKLPSHISRECCINRLSEQEKEGLANIIQILYSDYTHLPFEFTSCIAVGSIAYKNTYREDMQGIYAKASESALDIINDNEFDDNGMRINTISKSNFYNTLEKKGNDIDIIFFGDEALVRGHLHHNDMFPNISLRDFYMTKLIPEIFKKNNINFSTQQVRIDGSSYMLSPDENSLYHTKYINSLGQKKNSINIHLPNCRAIHIDVQPINSRKKYHEERTFYSNGGLSLLYHYARDKKIFLDMLRSNIKYQEPEKMTLEEKIQTIRHKKNKLNWDDINLLYKKMIDEKKGELPF